MTPNELRMKDGYYLQQSLGDNSGLKVTMIGANLATNLLPIVVAFLVKVLVSGTAGSRSHGRHPEIITINSHGMDGLFEGDLDFETHPIEADDVQRAESHVSGKGNLTTSVRMT